MVRGGCGEQTEGFGPLTGCGKAIDWRALRGRTGSKEGGKVRSSEALTQRGERVRLQGLIEGGIERHTAGRVKPSGCHKRKAGQGLARKKI